MAKPRLEKKTRQPIKEAVQRQAILKQFKEYLKVQPMPAEDFMILISNKSPIAPHYRSMAESLANIGRKDCLVVVVNDFEDVAMFSREDMRAAGWAWVGAPRDEKVDGQYWEDMQYTLDEINLRSGGKKYTMQDLALFQAAYRLNAVKRLEWLQKSWERAKGIHADLDNWHVPDFRATAWQRFWIRLLVWWNLRKKESK